MWQIKSRLASAKPSILDMVDKKISFPPHTPSPTPPSVTLPDVFEHPWDTPFSDSSPNFPSIFLLSFILLCLLQFHLLHLFRYSTHPSYNLLYHSHLQQLHAVVAPCARRLAFMRLPTRPYTPTRPATPLTSILLRLASCNHRRIPIRNLIPWH